MSSQYVGLEWLSALYVAVGPLVNEGILHISTSRDEGQIECKFDAGSSLDMAHLAFRLQKVTLSALKDV